MTSEVVKIVVRVNYWGANGRGLKFMWGGGLVEVNLTRVKLAELLHVVMPAPDGIKRKKIKKTNSFFCLVTRELIVS